MVTGPAEVALDYEVRQFHLGFAPDTTEYQGAPSDEVDQKWSDLYDMGNTLLDKDQAMLIPNKTILFPHDPNHRYLVNLDVFHQLHCLNLIRQAFHPEYYKPHNPGPHAGDEDGLLGPSHISHCIDSIRQSLMCNADISVMNWVWNERKGQNQPIGQNYHTCRRFDKIQEWARQHATYEPVDVSFREMDDPLSTAG
ncbi:hypothetical protein GQ53DRAFT_744732 [Thozetella sp. PMI_491]|nr:hypothetical protein GQ53DRAFT_744732 [Thozetella sp. PMI_491]